MSEYEFYLLLARGISTVVIASSFLIAAYQVRLLIENHRDNHDWNRRIETQKAIRDVVNMDIQKLNETFGFKHRKDPIPLEEITNAFENDWDLENQCLRLINTYENLAAGIKLGIFDEDVVIINRRGNMERTFLKFKNYIEHRRYHTKNTTYQEYQNLVEKWQSEEKYSGRKSPIAK